MNQQFRRLRLQQLDRTLRLFEAAHNVARPPRGWLAAIREASGLTLRELASRLGAPHQSVASLEKSEAEDTITLKSLKKVAAALDCDVVYAVVPRKGSVEALVHQRIQEQAAADVKAVEHTMSLEDQAVGDLPAKVEEETRHRLEE
jgi:predicted DNA-binding mobile mystery protein A